MYEKELKGVTDGPGAASEPHPGQGRHRSGRLLSGLGSRELKMYERELKGVINGHEAASELHPGQGIGRVFFSVAWVQRNSKCMKYS